MGMWLGWGTRVVRWYCGDRNSRASGGSRVNGIGWRMFWSRDR
jgi:hypothetical protein